MTAINAVVDYALDGDVGVITLHSPPVNALSKVVRKGLADALAAAAGDARAKAVVLVCAGRTFIAGAEISELGLPEVEPTLAQVEQAFEDCSKPVTAAIHGTALGGGLELALACHYRLATPSARVGLPEVNLGLIPGAAGTQRLPRAAGVEAALRMVVLAEQATAQECLDLGLIDEIVPEDQLRAGAAAFAHRLAATGAPLKKIRDQDDKVAAARAHPEVFAAFRQAHARKFRGYLAPEYGIRAVEAAVSQFFDEGVKTERRLFDELLAGPQSAAQRYAFFAERAAAKIPDVPADTPVLPVNSVGIVGAGSMGGGIAMSFANAGLPVTLVDVTQTALDRGLGVIRRNYERTAARGGLSAAEVAGRLGLIRGSLALEDLKDADLIVEAVFERMDVKQETFARLDAIAKDGAILATNTSALNIDEIASVTRRPEAVIGLHFFSPAHVMKLVEVIRADRTAKPVIATCMRLTRRLGKVGVLARVTPGFIGNRMLAPRQREAAKLVLDGAMPWDVDRALQDFGFPMGPFAMSDLAGLDIGWTRETSRGETLRERLCELGRFGQKTGGGYYDYDENRLARPSPVTEAIVREMAAKSRAPARTVCDAEILERCLYPMVNEGVKLLDEGIAIRASDIDVIWEHGYGWPAYSGGPMWWGEHVGLARVLARLKIFQAELGEAFAPAPLLENLVAEGKGFEDL